MLSFILRQTLSMRLYNSMEYGLNKQTNIKSKQLLR